MEWGKLWEEIEQGKLQGKFSKRGCGCPGETGVRGAALLSMRRNVGRVRLGTRRQSSDHNFTFKWISRQGSGTSGASTG